MKWGAYKDCVTFVTLFQCDYVTSKIHTMLKLLKLNQYFILCIIKRYLEIGDVDNWARSDHPRITWTREIMKAVGGRVVPNPLWKQKILSWNGYFRMDDVAYHTRCFKSLHL